MTRSASGSSPLSRGILLSLLLSKDQRGIIPALAGNTSQCLLSKAIASDHPRSRGEYDSRETFVVFTCGSSPLSRGILSARATLRARPWIIPALAGNTASSVYWGTRKTDHPRSRGEYFREIGLETEEMGSSPLSRGIPAEGV